MEHNGHRRRVRKRFLNYGLEGLEDHQILELILFYAIPRGDTNITAHRLIEAFGNINSVFDAPYEELIKIDGIGENAASLIKLIPEAGRACRLSKVREIKTADSAEKAAEYLSPYFMNSRNELIYSLFTDSAHKILGCVLINEGGLSSAEINVRKIMENAIRLNASSVILAHNHIGTSPAASDEDLSTTKELRRMLLPLGVKLLDHLIFSMPGAEGIENIGYVSVAREYGI